MLHLILSKCVSINFIKDYMKNTHFQCRPFWITNCCPHGQNLRWVLIVLKSAYQN